MSVTEDIKARLDIVNFISQYVPLKKAGRNYKAPCPFHSERTPSFVVFPDTQNWRCFGACGEGGDIFNFVMKQEGLDFASALRVLADKAGVELHQRSPDEVDRDEHLDKLRGLLEETTRFFNEKLWESPDGDTARHYVHKRGLTDETIEHFMIGFAPHDWRQALDHLLSLGYTEDDAIEAGVAIRNEKGRVYDRFRNRVVIPIRDGRGLVTGFGARALAPDDSPKYLNSPQTALFDKSATLFGLDKARRAIREGETAVIVEGYMDAIQAHQAGFTNVVAQMGTALTELQLKQLSVYARRLILALDPDVAGMTATMRGLDVMRQTLGDSSVMFDPKGIMRQGSKLGVEILVMTLPEGKDPDDLIREDTGAWRSLVANAEPVADYVINVGTAHITPKSTFSDREEVARQLLPILVATENDLQQHYNIQRLALKLHLDERLLIEWSQRHTRRMAVKTEPVRDAPRTDSKKAAPGSAPAAKRPDSGGRAMEYYCLALLVRQPDLLYVANRKLREIGAKMTHSRQVLGALSPEDFTRSDMRAIFVTLERALAQDDLEPIEYLKQHMPYELCEEVDKLLVEELEVFKQRLNPSLHAQLEAEVLAAQKKREWMVSPTIRASGSGIQHVVEQYVLELRKQRLERENRELQFLQQEADADTEMEYNRRVSVNRQALKFIDNAARQASQLQREQ
jgi:DNA primase